MSVIVGVTGHQNIPEEAIGFVKDEIMKTLCQFNEGITGVSALAAGADQIFAETVLQVRGSLHVVVPCRGYESTFEKHENLQLFRRLLKKAHTIETLEHDCPSEEAYLDAGHRIVDISNVLIAVWDGFEARGKGGTADVVAYARRHRRQVFVIWPTGVFR